ncbi:MAG: RBBP9/YdeN family alpha/beta hydrolase [Flavobacterium sp.]
MKPNLLLLPGLGDSGPRHWQKIWLKELPNIKKIKQDNWDKPILADWLLTLQTTISVTNTPTILIAHSLGTILVAHWAHTFKNPNIIGALLVAPADVDSTIHTPEIIWNFAPIPTKKLPFPTIVVGSENDPYMTLKRAEELAKNWGSQFINCGPIGHINTESNLGNWQEGQKILQQLIEKIATKSANHSQP